jgi:hypothetical protein
VVLGPVVVVHWQVVTVLFASGEGGLEDVLGNNGVPFLSLASGVYCAFFWKCLIATCSYFLI